MIFSNRLNYTNQKFLTLDKIDFEIYAEPVEINHFFVHWVRFFTKSYQINYK